CAMALLRFRRIDLRLNGRRARYAGLVTVLLAISVGCGGQQPVSVPLANPPAAGPSDTANLPSLPPVEEAEPGLKLEPVVFLDPVEEPTTPTTQPRPTLLRELFRQALLLAGREELGLATRDGTLRESAPEGLAADNHLLFSPAFEVGGPAAQV